MPDPTVTLSVEDVRRSHRGTDRALVQLRIKDLIGQPEERFQAVTRRIMEKI